jgi:hypothetical protein
MAARRGPVTVHPKRSPLPSNDERETDACVRAAPEFRVRTRGVPSAGIDYGRLYSYRFQDVGQAGRQAVWREIARYMHGRMGAPERVLDPAADRGEFITAVPAARQAVPGARPQVSRRARSVSSRTPVLGLR